MEPDIILLPGDIIDDHPGVFIQKYGTYYETNDSATRRIWCVRKSRILRTSSSRILQEMDKIDIRILLDEVITIEDDFYLVGRRIKQSEIAKALKTYEYSR